MVTRQEIHERVWNTHWYGPTRVLDVHIAALRRKLGDRATGTGLGLAIVHRLVTADGGNVTLSDTPGGGLTVTLDLPTDR